MGLTDEEYFYKAKTVLPSYQQKVADQQCDQLRINFIKNWIMKANLDLYKTETERDWGYIGRREYRGVRYQAVFKSLAVCSFLQTASFLLTKKPAIHFYIFMPLLAWSFFKTELVRNNKRIFDQLNIGTEYELGAERNRILEECNRIANRSDF